MGVGMMRMDADHVEGAGGGVKPEEWIGKFHVEHQEDFTRFGVGFDHYGSTNDG